MRYRIIVFLAAIVLSAGAVAYFTYNRSKEGENAGSSFFGRLWSSVSNREGASDTEQKADIPVGSTDEGFRREGDRYINTAYGFSFALGSEYQTQVNHAGDDSSVLTFDAEGEKDFQIFVMPHDEPAITPERIKLDVPDIIMENIRTATLSDTDALVFNSRDDSLGETYEVWFIHGSYLYQIMTYAKNEQTLNGIMGTWSFD